MDDDHRLTTPRIEVTLDDGTTFVVQALNPDLVRWDRQASKLGWPKMSDAPFLWLTFLAWSAAKREGAIPADLSWEVFGDTRCVQVRALTNELGDLDGVDPTPREVAPA
jgi:hypothetical protein